MIEAPELAIAAGTFILCTAILGVVAIHFIDRVLSDARMLSMAALEQCQNVSTSVILASSGLNSNGVNPHVVDPERFGPTGMSRRDETPTTKDPSEELSEDELALREAEAVYSAQRASYNPDGTRRVVTMTRAPGAPPGAITST